MSKQKTTNQYIRELSDKESRIELCPGQEYTGAFNKLLFRFKECGHEQYIAPGYALSGKIGCKICRYQRISKYKSKTSEQYIKELENIMPHIKLVGKYDGMTTKTLHYCSVHNVTWNAFPNNILRGCGCKQCGMDKNSEHFTFPIESYLSVLNTLNIPIQYIAEYGGLDKKCLHRCLLCGHEWYISPRNIELGGRCPICCTHYSSGERNIEYFLKNNKINYEKHKTFDGLIGLGGGQLSYDFYLPDSNKLIEAQGKQHDEPIEFFGGKKQFEKQQEHDKRKREYARQHNIELIEIRDYNIKNIEIKLKSVTTTG